MNEALKKAGLLAFFTPKLIFYGLKDSTAIFMLAVERAGHKMDPQKCLFVGENKSERQFAAAAGLRTAESPQAPLKL